MTKDLIKNAKEEIDMVGRVSMSTGILLVNKLQEIQHTNEELSTENKAVRKELSNIAKALEWENFCHGALTKKVENLQKREEDLRERNERLEEKVYKAEDIIEEWAVFATSAFAWLRLIDEEGDQRSVCSAVENCRDMLSYCRNLNPGELRIQEEYNGWIEEVCNEVQP